MCIRDSIIIDPNYRRKGLASKLINELRKKGGDKGVELFTLNVDKKNLAAFYLYEKLGFLKDKNISKNTVRMKTILYA